MHDSSQSSARQAAAQAMQDTRIVDTVIKHVYLSTRTKEVVAALRDYRTINRLWRDTADTYLVRKVAVNLRNSCVRNAQAFLDPILYHRPFLFHHIREVELFDWTPSQRELDRRAGVADTPAHTSRF